MSNKKHTQSYDNLDKVLDKLFSLHRFGIKPGLERTLNLLEKGGNPQLRFKSVHIAGTNGKGSVSSLVASILMEAGYNVGLYTSPHLVKFNERIRINGVSISDDELIELTKKYMPFAEENESTFFEITTAMAFDYFAEQDVDIAVIEAGMGGRFDSTNVLSPLVSLITTIGTDHYQYLGDTIEEIATEKAGIIKPRTPVIILDDNPKLRHIFVEKAERESALIQFVNKDYGISVKKTGHPVNKKLLISACGDKFEVYYKLTGTHQIDNLRLAIAGIESLIPEFEIRTPDIESGIEYVIDNCSLRARCELLRKQPPVFLDSSHNAESVEALLDTIVDSSYSNEKFNILFGAMKDKDVLTMLAKLKPYAGNFFFTTPKTDRAVDESEFKQLASRMNIEYQYFNDVVDAYIYANKLNEPLIITGSFYLAGEVLKYLEY